MQHNHGAVIHRKKLPRKSFRRLMYRNTREEQQQPLVDSLPDRIVHPEEYGSLHYPCASASRQWALATRNCTRTLKLNLGYTISFVYYWWLLPLSFSITTVTSYKYIAWTHSHIYLVCRKQTQLSYMHGNIVTAILQRKLYSMHGTKGYWRC